MTPRGSLLINQDGAVSGRLSKSSVVHCLFYVYVIYLANVQSLPNKTDELLCRIQSQREARDCAVFCLSETWLHTNIPDSAVQPPGFTAHRADREKETTGKSRGGGGAEGKPGVHSNLDEVQNSNRTVTEKNQEEVHEKSKKKNATPEVPRHAAEEVKPVNMFTIIMGETYQAFQKLLEKLRSHSPRITKSEDIDGCDAILVISSFQSWNSACMKAALRTILAPDKPVVLVLVHKPGSVQPGTRHCAEFPTLKEEVHIEYNYTENKLQECDMNQKAIKDLKELCDQFYSTGWEMMQMEI